MIDFIVRGSGNNLVLERRNGSARPASPEEMAMYVEIASLKLRLALALGNAEELALEKPLARPERLDLMAAGHKRYKMIFLAQAT